MSLNTQAIYRKLVCLGLRELFTQSEEVRLIAKMAMSLPLLPPHRIGEGFAAIKERAARLEDQQIQALLSYVTRYFSVLLTYYNNIKGAVLFRFI